MRASAAPSFQQYPLLTNTAAAPFIEEDGRQQRGVDRDEEDHVFRVDPAQLEGEGAEGEKRADPPGPQVVLDHVEQQVDEPAQDQHGEARAAEGLVDEEAAQVRD